MTLYHVRRYIYIFIYTHKLYLSTKLRILLIKKYHYGPMLCAYIYIYGSQRHGVTLNRQVPKWSSAMLKAKSLKVLVVLLPSPVLRSTRPPGGGGAVGVGYQGEHGDIGYWI